ncbi:MAG TPA: tRNA-dihydrouridine synthase, partial [Paludibacteraceae bacterium]|nr:tRNA-dihydrouridine synthase [Paludibacteraceae bacterium]
MYKGDADWTLIGEVKNNPRMHIPIIGNGDVTTPERAKECFERYGVDAVMIGRGAIGRPWIFEEINYFFENGECKAPYPFGWQVDILKEHVLRSIEWIGDERKGIVHSRRHLAATPVFKGIADFRQTRIAMLRAETLDEFFGIIDGVVAEHENSQK